MTNAATTPLPPRLYKYEPFNTRTLANLKQASIWFSAPVAFNDPFDCALPVVDTTKLTEPDFQRAHDSMAKEPEVAREVKNLCPDGVPTPRFRGMILESVAEVFVNRRQSHLEQRGVACFSAKPLDIMMWSHYADGHRGFCLGFDTAFQPFSTALEVQYREDFPYVNPINVLVEPSPIAPDNELLRAMALTKSLCWKYEQEWRILHMHGSTLFTYDYRALKDIYFGAAMPRAHKDILSLVLDGAPTQAHEVRQDEKGFGLLSIPVRYERFNYQGGPPPRP